MVINQATLSGIYRAFNALFNEALQNTRSQYKRVAMVVPSSAREENYNWLGAFPRMREWLGDRIIQNLSAFSYTIKNKDFEVTVEVDRNDIMDDSIGIYTPIIKEMGRSTETHPDELIFTLLKNGFTELCYDGQFFFDTDHPVGESSVSNHGGGTGTPWFLLDTSRAIRSLIFQSRLEPQIQSLDKPNDENVFMRKKYLYGADRRDNAGYGLWQLAYGSKQTLDETGYAAAREAMLSFKDETGRPLNIVPDLLVVPPSLEGQARAILLNERDASGATNKWKGSAEFLMSPWLA